MKKKTKKKIIAKRRTQQNNMKSASKRTRKQVTYSSGGTAYSDVPYFSDIKAPEGYMTVSSSQAMIKYAEPVMDKFELMNIEDSNEAFRVVTLIWNYTIGLNNASLKRNTTKDKNDIIKSIAETLSMKRNEAEEFLQVMVERKNKLLPYEIQPHGTITMYMLKEKDYDITDLRGSAQVKFPLFSSLLCR
jgi:hypothetical protein